eukprot:1155993-Pelagomonas_calceolata.AAC.12
MNHSWFWKSLNERVLNAHNVTHLSATTRVKCTLTPSNHHTRAPLVARIRAEGEHRCSPKSLHSCMLCESGNGGAAAV